MKQMTVRKGLDTMIVEADADGYIHLDVVLRSLKEDGFEAEDVAHDESNVYHEFGAFSVNCEVSAVWYDHQCRNAHLTTEVYFHISDTATPEQLAAIEKAIAAHVRFFEENVDPDGL